MKQSFYGGVHPNDRKELARHKEVAPLSAAPKQVVIAMAMHVGAPCKPIVAVGDQVKVGQKIGEIAGLGAPIHASVSGVVKAVEPRPYVGGGKVMSVVIENDFQDTWGSVLTPHPDYSKLSCEEIVEIVKEAGITGMGGAGFPTHVKISSGVGKVDTLILNGAECEPYITADHRLMLEQGERVIGGVRILMQAFGLKNAVIGVEANKEDAIEHLKALVGGKNDVQVESLRTPHPDYSKLSCEEIVEIVKEAGITGMGGAGFPTHVKISSGVGKVDTLILNGAECEPYITADHRLMLEQGERVIGGVRILMQAFGLKNAVIGVEANKEDAIEHLKALVGGKNDVQVESLRTRYPQGAEKQLIQRVTGREVPPGGLPAHVGCAVFNVGTAAAVYDAVVEGKPLTHRILTVTGDAIKEPKNLLVPLGTSFQQIIDEGKGFKEEPDRVLTGGPMMGIAQYNLDVTCIKGTNAVLCLTKKEAAPVVEEEVCLRCGRCVNVCPMHLTPVYMHLYAEKGMWKEAEALNVMDCIECGSCNYICPARLHLVQSFRVTKGELRALAAKEKAAKEAAKA